jgi:hypothetical protein
MWLETRGAKTVKEGCRSRERRFRIDGCPVRTRLVPWYGQCAWAYVAQWRTHRGPCTLPISQDQLWLLQAPMNPKPFLPSFPSLS